VTYHAGHFSEPLYINVHLLMLAYLYSFKNRVYAVEMLLLFQRNEKFFFSVSTEA